MAYQMTLDMGITDFAISRAIRELSQQRETFTNADIAKYVGCSLVTVNRTVPRLIKSGKVERTGSNRKGYKFSEVANV
jgi:CRP-like cAMP-binding protein